MLVMTETVQDYLKAIWMLDRSSDGNVTTSALAERLGVTAASATAMIKQLNTANLTTKSMQKRILEKLSADGFLPGTVQGTPDP